MFKGVQKNKHKHHLAILLLTMAAFSLIGFILLTSSSAAPQDSNDPNFPLADTNEDLKVDIFDLSYLLGKWNTNDSAADFNTDGAVNIQDLSYLLAQWGREDTLSPTVCSWDGNPNNPMDDPNPPYSGNYGRAPVSSAQLPAGYPTPLTTGICGIGLTESDLTPSGTVVVTVDGTVIDGLDITGTLDIKANNVTVRNTRVT